MRAGERRAQMAARAIVTRFAIESPEEIHVREIALVCGLYIQEREIQGAQGRLVRSRNRRIATVNALIAYEGKKRFAAAHELGHHQLHEDVGIFVCTDADFLDWHRSRPEETEANVFAAELLMPHRLFVADACKYAPSIATVHHLADSFRVTRTAAAIRYVDVDAEPCAVVFCRNGVVKWSRCSDSMPYRYIKTKRCVHPDSGAAEYFRRDDTVPEPAETPVSAWFIDYDQDPGATCMEDYMTLPSINATLSLIWVE